MDNRRENKIAGIRPVQNVAVPDELVDEVALVGPKERIVERLQAWKAASEKGHVGSMLIGAGQTEALEVIANEML